MTRLHHGTCCSPQSSPLPRNRKTTNFRQVYYLKFVAPLFTVLLLIGCDSNSPGEVKSASGETRVKYVVCSMGDSNCTVTARFNDLDKCQSYKDWADMVCDKIFTPSKMTCVQDDNPKIGITYCTM